MSGWIKLHRKMVDWGWFQDPNTSHLFLYLLLEARTEDGFSMGIPVKRGQVVTGRKKLSIKTGLSERQVRTSLGKLKSTSELTIKTTNKFSLITICNYNGYQSTKTASDQLNDQQSDQQSVRPATTKQEVKKKEERITTKRKSIKKKNSFNPVSAKPDHISSEDWADLIEHRRKVGGAETERAYSALVREFDKAMGVGFSVRECVDRMCLSSWRGFSADWMGNKKSRKEEHDDTRERFARDLLEKNYGYTFPGNGGNESLGSPVQGQSTNGNGNDSSGHRVSSGYGNRGSIIRAFPRDDADRQKKK